ncbi:MULTISPECIES: hypothetical protein [unclassified Streptomyces]|uniref:hypothetical protein n=1 Tax=unclassified Streptomyces TaxID=2593676 RepID=UPI0004BD105B|nr:MULTISPECIES: hypothetical protein [unclassified Streptomyces]
MTTNSIPKKRSAVAAALVPLFVVAGLLLGPAGTASAAAPAVRQAPAAVTLPQNGALAGAGVVTGLQAPMSSQVRATTGTKKGKKSKKKKGGLFKTLLIVLLVVVALLLALYLVRRAMRRRSA